MMQQAMPCALPGSAQLPPMVAAGVPAQPLGSAAAAAPQVMLVEEESLLLQRFPPYSRVLLCDLTKNLELNGKHGIVVPQSVSVWPAVPGCLKVRLASGQEVAVKPGNMRLLP